MRHEYNIEIMKNLFKEKGYELLENEYVNMKQKVNFICNKHKDKGIQQTTFWQAISYAKQCKECKTEEIRYRNYYNSVLREPEYIKMCHKNHWVYQGFEIKGNGTCIKYICLSHIEKGVQKIRINHLKKGVQCPYCKHKHITTQDLINDPRIQDVEILGEYKRNDIKIKCRCKKCGRILYITPNHLQQGKGCKYCHNSLGENKITKCLDSNNINYKYQYMFDDCRNIYPLPFDFYLPDYNICIEYNGEQHYRAVEYFGGTKSFRRQQERDKIKEQYCKDNNIKLITIPYTQFNNIENILDNMLETVTTAG